MKVTGFFPVKKRGKMWYTKWLDDLVHLQLQVTIATPTPTCVIVEILNLKTKDLSVPLKSFLA